MESVFRFLSRFFREKRGSSTMEYVVILAVGALFAALLFHALQGDEVRSAIQTAVENAILGKTIDAPGKDTKISHEGNRDLSDVPSPTEIPESLVDSNNPSGSNDSLKNQRDQSPIPNGFTLFGNLFYGIGVLPDTTDDPWKGLADITGLDIFASKWSTEDWLICAQGVWECLNKEDIKRDRRDLANDPKGYISDVLGLDEWKRRWEGIKRIDLTGQWRDFTDDPGGYFDRKWNFTKERMGSWWADISRTPGNYAKDLLLDAIGWYDVQAWWTGRDPQTGERLRVENRKARLLFAFPLPYTKGAKYTKKGINLVGDFADFAIDLACAKGKKKEKCDGTSKFDVQEFEKKIAHLPTAERIAIIKQEAQKIARNNGWERDSKLSRINNREIYYDSKTKKYYALDTRHGRFEVLDKKGKHQGEVDFNLNPTKPADKSRRHDIRVR